MSTFFLLNALILCIIHFEVIELGVGMRLKEVLRDRGINIKQLSIDCGISLNTLYSITKRDSDRVDDVVLKRIADTLGIPQTYLKDGDMTGMTQTFLPFTKTDVELLRVGGFGALAEFYNLPEDAQKEAMKDIHGFVEYTIAKYKKQPTQDPPEDKK